MDSPAAAAPPPPRRKPLQPKNFHPAQVSGPHPKPKLISLRTPPPTGGCAGKENRPISLPEPEPEPAKEAGPREASLAEELAAIRRMRERLRAERERTEKVLRERDAAMQRWSVELEKRAEEQRNLELELRLLIKLQDLRSSWMISSPLQYLREREQKKSMQVQIPSPVQSLREKEQQKNMEVQQQVSQTAEQKSEVDETSSISTSPASVQKNETKK